MSLFRRNTIFHVEESIPDPEEIRVRRHRRILFCAVIWFVTLLGVPMAHELRPNIHARAEARRFAERMLQARTLASEARAPVGFELGADKQSWLQVNYLAGDTCTNEASGPHSPFSSEGISWKLQAQQENGNPLTGHRLCWHPGRGLLLDSVPLENGKLLVTLSGAPEEGAPEQVLASVLVTQGGAEMQTISY
jgi:hypothetical protein